jgi:hypothetical protein
MDYGDWKSLKPQCSTCVISVSDKRVNNYGKSHFGGFSLVSADLTEVEQLFGNFGKGRDEEAEMGNGRRVLGAGRVDTQDPGGLGPAGSGRPNSTGTVQRLQPFEGQAAPLHAALHDRTIRPLLRRRFRRPRSAPCTHHSLL